MVIHFDFTFLPTIPAIIQVHRDINGIQKRFCDLAAVRSDHGDDTEDSGKVIGMQLRCIYRKMHGADYNEYSGRGAIEIQDSTPEYLVDKMVSRRQL